MSGRTVLIIAHRLSTVEKAHRIVVIEKGAVMEQGTHKELLTRGGMYASLVKRQILGFDLMSSNTESKEVENHPVMSTSVESKNSNFSFHSCDTSTTSVVFKVGSS